MLAHWVQFLTVTSNTVGVIMQQKQQKIIIKKAATSMSTVSKEPLLLLKLNCGDTAADMLDIKVAVQHSDDTIGSDSSQ